MRIRGIKGKRRKEKKDFWPLRNPGGKGERKKTREKGESREILAKNQHLLKRKRRDLAFQESSHT